MSVSIIEEETDGVRLEEGNEEGVTVESSEASTCWIFAILNSLELRMKPERPIHCLRRSN